MMTSIRKEESSYGFIHYFDRRSAALAIFSLSRRNLFKKPIKVNWAYASVYPSCSGARVMWDQKTWRSRGFGFVSFRNQQDAQSAINDLSANLTNVESFDWSQDSRFQPPFGQLTLPPGSADLIFHNNLQKKSATLAILSLSGRHLFGQPIKVNWAYASGQREDTSGHFNVFVGDLNPEVTDAMLFGCFSVYPSCSGARVMWDQKTGRSRGFGFVSFRNQQDAQNAINDLSEEDKNWLAEEEENTANGGGNWDKKKEDSVSLPTLSEAPPLSRSQKKN
ncbi:hypothetical protein COLO4_04340 [Corchorus olitorius]|uniref:RRM domain-containing protein n=1 Tax=Corchorus olitorius TaxID=93759 RepID=A0A1R3KUE6_9ROSI|nr:hypothetical protein COLO4_04340 [Corchorus olitorius]